MGFWHNRCVGLPPHRFHPLSPHCQKGWTSYCHPASWLVREKQMQQGSVWAVQVIWETHTLLWNREQPQVGNSWELRANASPRPGASEQVVLTAWKCHCPSSLSLRQLDPHPGSCPGLFSWPPQVTQWSWFPPRALLLAAILWLSYLFALEPQDITYSYLSGYLTLVIW